MADSIHSHPLLDSHRLHALTLRTLFMPLRSTPSSCLYAPHRLHALTLHTVFMPLRSDECDLSS
ncbi:MAG: hypothetical protein HDS70_07395 [Bacteroidales bacterium]|nr:hypothetical protein [Bacteroidales bacterium]